jgi:hypothetical protein
LRLLFLYLYGYISLKQAWRRKAKYLWATTTITDMITGIHMDIPMATGTTIITIILIPQK